MKDLIKALEALPDALSPAPRLDIFCAECRTGPPGKHSGLPYYCGCCDDCGLPFHDGDMPGKCRCGCPPRGVVLSQSWLRRLRKDIEGRRRNEGAPYWSERVGALLDHIDLLTNPRLPTL